MFLFLFPLSLSLSLFPLSLSLFPLSLSVSLSLPLSLHFFRAKAKGIKVEVVHNTSVMGAVASCGLQLYQFGYTVSVPLFEGTQYTVQFVLSCLI